MSLNSTPSSERIHIGFFGKRNAGKSSLINAITAQDIAIVSDIKGTTTDPVYKAMELLPLGPVMIIDTPGLDDEGKLGKLRIEKTKQVLNKVDIAILVVDATLGMDNFDYQLIACFKERNIKYIIVHNKSDLCESISDSSSVQECLKIESNSAKTNEIYVSTKNNLHITELKELIANLFEEDINKQLLVKDLIKKNDLVILVTPIDSAAPKGRLILPQQQVIRDLLDGNAITITVRECELEEALNSIKKKPKLIITDSQVFKKVSEYTPADIYLTSFSILFARYKGILFDALEGVKTLELLNDNDTILISEGCTHHRQCDDIGSVKLPAWIKKYSGKNINFEFSSGGSFPNDLSKYKMIIHCGGCMLKDKEVLYRYKSAKAQNVAITNYGITIAYIHGILQRCIEIFYAKSSEKISEQVVR